MENEIETLQSQINELTLKNQKINIQLHQTQLNEIDQIQNEKKINELQ